MLPEMRVVSGFVVAKVWHDAAYIQWLEEGQGLSQKMGPVSGGLSNWPCGC